MATLHEMTDGTPFAIRPASPDDLHYFLNSWLRTFRERYLSHELDNVKNETYFAKHRELLIRCMQRESTRALTACQPDNVDVIYGYGVFEGANVIHWMHVKRPWRSLGVGAALVRHAGIPLRTQKVIITHLTTDVARILNVRGVEYDPYAR